MARGSGVEDQFSAEDTERTEEVRRPLSTNGVTISDGQRAFLRAFPLKRFPVAENPRESEEALAYAEKLLLSKKMQQLIALLCHLVTTLVALALLVM